MESRDEFELRVVEPRAEMKQLEMPRLAAPTKRHPPTAHEMLSTLRGMRGAAALIERAPIIEDPTTWGDLAYFSVCRSTGSVAGGVILWDCDHIGFEQSMQVQLDNCYALFAGADQAGLTDLGSPNTLTGRVCCIFTVPNGGYYVFNVQVEPSDLNQVGPSIVECFIDDQSFGQIVFQHPINHPLAAVLPAGVHQFQIRQVSSGFFFQSVSVWAIPVVQS